MRRAWLGEDGKPTSVNCQRQIRQGPPSRSLFRGAAFVVLIMIALDPAVSFSQQANSNPIDSRIMKRWERKLLHAGASRRDLSTLEEVANERGNSVALQEYLAQTPLADIVIWLKGLYRNEHEEKPVTAYPDATPRRRCDELKAVSIAETTLDETALMPDGTCQVTSIVTHLPAHDPIKVAIALPQKWNGRFRGTGGGGYAGGYKESLNQASKYGYVVGMTDTGNPEGTANFAINASGRPA